MAIVKAIRVQCDECSTEWDDSFGTVREAKETLRFEGWSFNNNKIKCPDCRAGTRKGW